MKKFYFYALVIACFFVSATIQAQDRYWIRAADNPGNWNDNSNWSTTPGGGGGASVPNSGANAFFPNGGTVNVDVTSITLGRLTASGGTTRLIANAATTITVQSSTLNNEGYVLRVALRSNAVLLPMYLSASHLPTVRMVW